MKIGLSNEINRIKWIKSALQKIPKGYKILDAGAGERQFQKFCSHLKYFSQDFAMYDGKGDGSALQTGAWNQKDLDFVCDITQIPVEDSKFGAAMCTEVLEHLPDPVAALNELSRIIKPSGYLIITAPFASLTHFAPYHFCSGFNKYFYTHHLDRLGFDILDIQPNGNFFQFIAQELRRITSVADMHSLKLFKLPLKVLSLFILGTLSILDKHDRGSSDLICFGYHVLARKKQ